MEEDLDTHGPLVLSLFSSNASSYHLISSWYPDTMPVYVVPPAGTECILVDMVPMNQTFVNTRRLRPKEPGQLSAGDDILFCHAVRMLYFSSSAFSKFLRQSAGAQLP